jgi:hypothetical protein
MKLHYFIYTNKKNTAFSGPIFMKLKNSPTALSAHLLCLIKADSNC